MATTTRFQLLHISDLHVSDGRGETFDRQRVLDPLIDRVRNDLAHGFRPEIVVVTGDIAFQGVAGEYDLAKPFFDDLMKALGLGQEQLFLVPGNHDVNRKRYRPRDIPAYGNMRELNEELENIEYRQDLLRGMEDYFGFVENHYPHLAPVDHRLVPFVTQYPASCGKRLGLIGLNSAWMCRRSDDQGTIALGEYQVQRAVAALEAMGPTDLRLVLLHHSLDWLWPVDRGICRTYLNNAILLAGHLHEARGGLVADLDGSFFSFQAGGAYIGSESDYPCRFHYITLDWENNTLKLDFRKFVAPKRKWALDADTGQDGTKAFPMALPDRHMVRPAEPETPLEIPEAYVNWIKDHCQYMDVEYLQVEGEAVRAELPEIFVPLYTQAIEKSEPGTRESAPEDREPVDIQSLMDEHAYLLIEGDAGSGKTTLLKHTALCLIQGRFQDMPAANLAGRLPVLIFLKDLKGVFDSAQGRSAPLSVNAILEYYATLTGNVLPVAVIERFIQARRVVFLLDGLDEMKPDHREQTVNAFALFKCGDKENKIVLSGRPHGISGAARNKFGEHLVRILPLNPEQVERFIRRWFQHIYAASTGLGTKTAEAMISEVRAHHAIDQLIINPLLLTATCILYYGGKSLPGQRAELYAAFINNLLHRRFDDPEKVLDFLSTLAFRMFERQIRGADEALVIEALGRVYRKTGEESDREYHRRLGHLFEEIEPRCGLLQLAEGEFNFRHLTFQEFLAALYIADNNTDYIHAIADYWDQPRYEETIELFIGYLSIKNKRWANQVVERALAQEDRDPFYRQRLAARALLDIHPNRRDVDVQDLAAEKLRAIFDSGASPKDLADAGETLGRLGDRRELERFVPIPEGAYPLSKGKMRIKSFEISQYPVTNQWYAKFMAAGGYHTETLWDEEGKRWLYDQKELYPAYWHEWRLNCPNAPVVGVSWYEACAFCRWLSAEGKGGYLYTLPTEHQWEAAAAGFEQREYPWGKWMDGYCNTWEAEIQKTSSVGIFKKGHTPADGVADLAGNVWEWTDSKYDEERYVLRGGCWDFSRDYARCANRDRFYPYNRNFNVGFRCVRTK